MKKVFTFALVMALLITMSVTASAVEITPDDLIESQSTSNVTVSYSASAVDSNASDSETWSVTVPSTAVADGQTQNVIATGSFAPSRTLTVTAPETVILYIDGDTSKDKAILAIDFEDIALAGSYKESSVSLTKTVSVEDMSEIKFGSWSGSFVFTIQIVDTEGYVSHDVLAQ